MAEEKPGLHIDSDWKRQAQEEKKRLAEEQAKAAPKASPAPAGAVASGSHAAAAPAGRGRPQEREIPAANFDSLVQSLVTQTLFYLGDLSIGGQQGINLDMARHNIDLLGMLEEKTRGNLSPQEQANLDAAAYEARMRFVSIAQRYAELP